MLDIKIHSQPDDVTCGPTSLHAVYEYYGKYLSLKQIVNEINMVASGGTVSPNLGVHALKNGFACTIYAYNIDIFDPSWFTPRPLSPGKLIHKLKEQLKFKNSQRIHESSLAYVKFLELGGIVLNKNLTPDLLKHFFSKKIPIITGLSATYLYKSKREYAPLNEEGRIDFHETIWFDDLKGDPSGHFVVLCGYDETHRHIVVADPHSANPISGNNYYHVSISRLINAIMLGVLTYDANLLLITRVN